MCAQNVLGIYNFAGGLRPTPPPQSRQSGRQQPDVTEILRTSVYSSVFPLAPQPTASTVSATASATASAMATMTSAITL